MIASLIFYLFAALAIASGVLVISARNPVHAVLFLILAFFNAAGLFVLMGAEFVAMILVIVYVGAVAVLFLFVVMMLDVNFDALRSGFHKHVRLGGIVGFVLLMELLILMTGWVVNPAEIKSLAAPVPENIHNTKALGQLLYTHYFLVFQLSGLVLLVAMIGAIVLTLRKRGGVRRQNPVAQMNRSRSETVSVVKVETGAGA